MENAVKPYAFSRKVFCEGMRDGVPIALGYFAVSFSLGIAARNAGLTPIQGFVASLFNNIRRQTSNWSVQFCCFSYCVHCSAILRCLNHDQSVRNSSLKPVSFYIGCFCWCVSNWIFRYCK